MGHLQKCSSIPIILFVLFGIGIFLTYYFDPTHDYPEMEITTTLAYMEEVSLTVPQARRNIFGVVDIVYPSGKIYITANSPGLIIADLFITILPGIEYAVPDEGKTYKVFNSENRTKEVTINALRGPSLADMSDYKTYWYLVAAFGQLVFSLVISMFIKRPAVIVRGKTGLPSPIARYLCCCTPCGRMPRSSREIQEMQEMTRLRIQQQKNDAQIKIQEQARKAEEASRLIREKAERRLAEIRAGTYRPTFWEKLCGVPETKVGSSNV